MAVTSVSLNTASAKLEINESIILTASVTTDGSGNEDLIWTLSDYDVISISQRSGSNNTFFYNASVSSSESRSLSAASYLLPSGSSMATIRTPSVNVNEGETWTINYFLKTENLNQFNQITTYLYNSSNIVTKSFAGSLWAVSQSARYEECITTVHVPYDKDVQYLKCEIKRGNSTISPESEGYMYVADISAKKGFQINENANTDFKTFDGTKLKIDELGNMQYYSASSWQDYFVYGLYVDYVKDFGVYASQSFNTVIGGYPGTTYLKSSSTAGMKYMPQFQQYFIPGNSLYNDMSDLTTRLNSIKSSSYYNDAYLGCWWDNEQYNQYDVPQTGTDIIKSILETGGTRDVPIIMHVGNVGMVRPLQHMIDASSVYTIVDYSWSNSYDKRVIYDFKIINNVENNSVRNNISLISMFGDVLTAQKYRASVYFALLAGAKGIVLFKDGKPSDVSGYTIYDISEMQIWDEIPVVKSEIDQMMPIIKKPHWTNWIVSSSHLDVFTGQRNYNGRGYMFIVNASDSSSSVDITIDTTNLYTPGNMTNYFTSSSVATASLNGSEAVYHLELEPYADRFVRIEKVSGDDVSDITGTRYTTYKSETVNQLADQNYGIIKAKSNGTSIVTITSDENSSITDTTSIQVGEVTQSTTKIKRYFLVHK